MFKLQHKITPFLWYDHQAGDAAAQHIAALQRAYDGR
jgi:predicted 3-demethylubiquinone-9 3-methyltransferase (glyoxalase superfamily)